MMTREEIPDGKQQTFRQFNLLSIREIHVRNVSYYTDIYQTALLNKHLHCNAVTAGVTPSTCTATVISMLSPCCEQHRLIFRHLTVKFLLEGYLPREY